MGDSLSYLDNLLLRANNNNYVLRFYRIRLSGLLSWCSLGISGISQNKQQIGFFVMRFIVEYSNQYRLVATAMLKILDFQFLKVSGSVRLSLRLCRILAQFVTFMLLSGYLGICFTLPCNSCLSHVGGLW